MQRMNRNRMRIKRMMQRSMDSLGLSDNDNCFTVARFRFYHILPIRSILSKSVFGRGEQDEQDAQSVSSATDAVAQAPSS